MYQGSSLPASMPVSRDSFGVVQDPAIDFQSFDWLTRLVEFATGLQSPSRENSLSIHQLSSWTTTLQRLSQYSEVF